MRLPLFYFYPALVAAAGVGAAASCSSSTPSGATGVHDAGAQVDTGPGIPSTDDGGGDDSSDLPPTPAAWDQPVTRPDDGTASSGRAACLFKRGDMPAKTLGASTPVDTAIPIENIVVVMMENRSFDSMFGRLNEFGNRTDVAEPPPGASNPSELATDAGAPATDAGTDAGADGGTDGGVVAEPWMHAPELCFADPDHSWKGQHWAYDDGQNDGFYVENNGTVDPGSGVPDSGALLSGERAMWWYDQTDIPFDYQVANTFAIADNYFCSLLGPTGPNRLFLLAATSFGLTYNTLPNGISPNLVDNVVVPDELEQRHVSWAVYSDGTPGLVDAISVGIVSRYEGRTIRFAFQDFLDAAKTGTMPQVAYVDPKVGLADGQPDNNDDHPPADIQEGSAFLSQVYQAVTTSPQWAHTALLITWDENGGIYDHVPPPSACAPDTTAPILTGTDVGVAGDFTRYGFRVPLLVVSPYAKKGYVSHGAYDHTSIARFIETKFKIPALTARDANADPLMDLFDFVNPPAFLTPPSIPAPTVDSAKLQYCVQTFGN
jgi:phospholipase C